LAPTTSSTQYSAPFDISGNTTIKAIAVKSGYNNSGVTTKIYKKTVVQTTYDAGYGNYLLIKGAGGPLGSWDSQYIMKWTTGNVWYWVTWEDFGSSTFTFKCFTNYGTWMPDPNRTGNVGETNYSAW